MNREQLIALVVATYIAVFIETAFDGFRNHLGVTLSLLPALLVYAAIRFSESGIVIVSVAGGLWHDSFSANPLGVSVAALFAVGYLLHMKREIVMHRLVYGQIALGFAAGFIIPILKLLFLGLLDQHAPWQWGLLPKLFMMGIGCAVFTPLVFRLFERLHRTFTFSLGDHGKNEHRISLQ